MFGAGYVGLVLALTLVLLIGVRLRAELVALLVLIALEIPGVLTRDEALAGFSNSAVITILGLFVLGAALERTGVADQMAHLLVRGGGASERRLILLVMLVTAGLSLVMNSIAAGAVVLPAAVTAARRINRPPSKVLMPVAFAAALGGMATIFTTANILISNTLRTANLAPLTFIDFFPVGSLLVLAGIIYMLLLGERLLPSVDPVNQLGANAPLLATYQLDERLWEVHVPADSPLATLTLAQADIGERFGVTVVARFRGQSTELTPGPATDLQPGDVLLIAGREDQVRQLPGVQIGRATRSSGYFSNPEVQAAEVVIAPRAPVLGQTLRELEFRRRYGVTVVAVWQNGRAYRTYIGDRRLQAGDGLLVVGPPERLAQLQADPGLVLVTPLANTPPRPHRAKRWLALAITILVLTLATARFVPTSIAVLVGMVLFVLSGCLTMDEALQAIDWRTIFIIAGMLPLSIAMQKTGLATILGQYVVDSVGRLGFLPLVAGLYIGTLLLTQVLGGQVTALVMGPITVAAALATHASPRQLGIVVAFACSSAFLTPLAHPVNLLVAAPGGYAFKDFARVGAGLTLVCLLVIMLTVGLLPGG